MTGLAGIPTSSASSAKTLPGKKVSGKTVDEERPDLPERPIFADFHSQMESDRSIPDAMPPAPPADLPSSGAPAETEGAAPALQLAATHHKWFGGGGEGTPHSEPVMQRKPPVSFRKAEPDASERVDIVEEVRQSDLPLPVLVPVGAPLPVAETVRTTNVECSAIAGHAPPPAAPAVTPPPIAPDQTRQQTQLHGLPGWFPGQHPDQRKVGRHAIMPSDGARFAAAPALTVPQVRNNRAHFSSAPHPETSAPARVARGGQFVSANVQASLSALESVLLRENLSGNANGPMKTAADGSSRGQQQHPARKDAGISSVRKDSSGNLKS